MSLALFLSACLNIALVMVALSALLVVIRLAKGPSMADRIVALDMITASVIAFCGLYAVVTGAEAFLDIGVTLALVGFVSVVALARYAERQTRNGDRDD